MAVMQEGTLTRRGPRGYATLSKRRGDAPKAAAE